jgi:hypothetical protein
MGVEAEGDSLEMLKCQDMIYTALPNNLMEHCHSPCTHTFGVRQGRATLSSPLRKEKIHKKFILFIAGMI